MFFVVHNEYHAILDVSSVRHSSPTCYYVTATAEQVALFHDLSANLPTDHYVELAEVLNSRKPLKAKAKSEHTPATAEFRKSVAGMFKTRKTKEEQYD